MNSKNKDKQLCRRFLDAAGLLVIHGIIIDGEYTKAQRRIERWAAQRGLCMMPVRPIHIQDVGKDNA